ncbi:MAG: putative spermidine/putrescine transport system permease protein [Chloroflexota bacterium]|jgi:putative spermidine/putrescine transport system permease protein|nr:putative spermidine/putrescine transport system permease protein [Chloroflexota bacterium]
MSILSDAPAALANAPTTSRRRGGPEPAFSLLFIVFTAYMLVPLVGVFLFSFATTWFDTILPVGYTVDHFVETINDPLFVPTVGRSLIAAIATIIVSVVLMTPVLFLLHVAAPRLRPIVEFLSLLPFALPTIVLALSLIRTYSSPPIVLSGTPTLLILAYVVTGLPFMYRGLDNSLRAIDTRGLSEASSTLGASRWTTLRRVILPNISTGIAAGALLVFSVSFGEFTLSSFIVGDAWKTSGVWTVAIWDDQPHKTTVMVLIGFAISWLISLIILFAFSKRATVEVGQR